MAEFSLRRELNLGHKADLASGRKNMKELVADEIANQLTPIAGMDVINASDFETFMVDAKSWMKAEGWTDEDIDNWENNSRFSRTIQNIKKRLRNHE